MLFVLFVVQTENILSTVLNAVQQNLLNTVQQNINEVVLITVHKSQTIRE